MKSLQCGFVDFVTARCFVNFETMDEILKCQHPMKPGFAMWCKVVKTTDKHDHKNRVVYFDGLKSIYPLSSDAEVLYS